MGDFPRYLGTESSPIPTPGAVCHPTATVTTSTSSAHVPDAFPSLDSIVKIEKGTGGPTHERRPKGSHTVNRSERAGSLSSSTSSSDSSRSESHASSSSASASSRTSSVSRSPSSPITPAEVARSTVPGVNGTGVPHAPTIPLADALLNLSEASRKGLAQNLRTAQSVLIQYGLVNADGFPFPISADNLAEYIEVLADRMRRGTIQFSSLNWYLHSMRKLHVENHWEWDAVRKAPVVQQAFNAAKALSVQAATVRDEKKAEKAYLLSIDQVAKFRLKANKAAAVPLITPAATPSTTPRTSPPGHTSGGNGKDAGARSPPNADMARQMDSSRTPSGPTHCSQSHLHSPPASRKRSFSHVSSGAREEFATQPRKQYQDRAGHVRVDRPDLRFVNRENAAAHHLRHPPPADYPALHRHTPRAIRPDVMELAIVLPQVSQPPHAGSLRVDTALQGPSMRMDEWTSPIEYQRSHSSAPHHRGLPSARELRDFPVVGARVDGRNDQHSLPPHLSKHSGHPSSMRLKLERDWRNGQDILNEANRNHIAFTRTCNTVHKVLITQSSFHPIVTRTRILTRVMSNNIITIGTISSTWPCTTLLPTHHATEKTLDTTETVDSTMPSAIILTLTLAKVEIAVAATERKQAGTTTDLLLPHPDPTSTATTAPTPATITVPRPHRRLDGTTVKDIDRPGSRITTRGSSADSTTCRLVKTRHITSSRFLLVITTTTTNRIARRSIPTPIVTIPCITTVTATSPLTLWKGEAAAAAAMADVVVVVLTVRQEDEEGTASVEVWRTYSLVPSVPSRHDEKKVTDHTRGRITEKDGKDKKQRVLPPTYLIDSSFSALSHPSIDEHEIDPSKDT
ncbi:hypothetical protein HKX48_007592 [Thoreauomyces humboldtii]|nr:hypothetical protein HKX48_007592 [Thoreauomyces humboldtii]